MGIINTNNVSWSTEKVPKCEVLILRYYESKHVNYCRSDDFSDEKKENPTCPGKSHLSANSKGCRSKDFVP
jgi:hypothetical protein